MKQNKYDDVSFFSAYEKMKKCKDRSKDLKQSRMACIKTVNTGFAK